MSASLGIAWMPMQRERLNSSPHLGHGLTDAVSGRLQFKPSYLFWQVEGNGPSMKFIK